MNMFHKLFCTCEEASLLSTMKEEGKVGISTRLRLWMHVQVCHFCKIFHLQNQRLNKLVNESKTRQSIVASAEIKNKWKSELISTKQE